MQTVAEAVVKSRALDYTALWVVAIAFDFMPAAPGRTNIEKKTTYPQIDLHLSYNPDSYLLVNILPPDLFRK